MYIPNADDRIIISSFSQKIYNGYFAEKSAFVVMTGRVSVGTHWESFVYLRVLHEPIWSLTYVGERYVQYRCIKRYIFALVQLNGFFQRKPYNKQTHAYTTLYLTYCSTSHLASGKCAPCMRLYAYNKYFEWKFSSTL